MASARRYPRLVHGRFGKCDRADFARLANDRYPRPVLERISRVDRSRPVGLSSIAGHFSRAEFSEDL